MNTTETIATRSGFVLRVETKPGPDRLEISFRGPVGRRCVLHWGLRRRQPSAWELPPPACWPPGTAAAGPQAVQTPFATLDGQAGVDVHLALPHAYASLEFVLFFPDERRWDNNQGRDYRVGFAQAGPASPAPREYLQAELGSENLVFERDFELESGRRLAMAVTQAAGRYRVYLASDLTGPLLLHWGLARRSPQEWLLPPESVRGPDARVDGQAAQTPFATRQGLNTLRLDFPEAEAPLGISFVLRLGDAPGRWLHCRGGNFYLPVHPAHPQATPVAGAAWANLANEIVQAETTHHSWTLMHRFNLCHDLLERVRHDVEGQALLYVWLRFSALRQLTWQRRFNTKPRELAHAQDRLTQRLAEIYRSEPAARPLTRLSLATVGRGGEGQRIRDEILNIMHRHHVKEVSGHFLEEWHQKLHNNTTPDDVIICEAYLEFLRSHGHRDRFYQTLEAGGVSKQRLESFERPIRAHPDFVPHLRDGLIHDFQNFLRILKASHSGTDLETAIQAARNHVDPGLQSSLWHLWEHRNAPPDGLVNLVSQITDVRRRLSSLLHGSQALREILYLDLALEQLLRGAVERNIHLRLSGDQLADLIARVLENVTLSYEDTELAACSRHWERLQTLPRFGPDWSLHAKSVGDRVARGLSAWSDRFYRLLQPKAEFLGRGFQAEPWTITLFSEEVVRGSSLGFVLSMLLHHLDPLLRQAAQLGNWQIVSRGRGAGQVEVVDALRSVQGRRFDRPTVIIADRVTGEEDIPDGITAVIAPDVVDIVSHVAVRARNAHLLFASCHDADLLQRLKALQGRQLQLEVNPAGDVLFRESSIESAAGAPAASPPVRSLRPSLAARAFTTFAVARTEFNERIVGGKSCHQARLRGVLPDWIHLPASAALPFGVFEHVLGHGLNQATATRYAELARQADSGQADALTALRQAVLELAAPEELITALRQAMARAELAWPEDWGRAWLRIKEVWASKWNDRAFLSRQRLGVPHANLSMAVLIQQVVPADYAFVIHTVNPSTGRAHELFGEVVLGLGETLVGNHPGRALSFVWDKAAAKATLLSYPGKSIGLYGRGLIFRSDSNGEDLAGYAGAGLYDSVLLDPPRPVELDYAQEPLVWDEGFRAGFLTALARIGLEIERLSGSPQDIEGAVSQGQYYVVQTRPQVGLE